MIYARETARAPEQWINRSDAPILFRGKDTDDTEIKTDPSFTFYTYTLSISTSHRLLPSQIIHITTHGYAPPNNSFRMQYARYASRSRLLISITTY